KLLVEPLKPRRHVHRVALRRIVEARRGAEIADDGGTRVNAHPRDAEIDAFGIALLAKILAERIDIHRAAHSMFGMIWKIDRRVENGEHRIADEFVDHAAVTQYDGGDALEITVQ